MFCRLIYRSFTFVELYSSRCLSTMSTSEEKKPSTSSLSEVEEQFNKAVEDLKKLQLHNFNDKEPEEDDLIEIYAVYNQAILGDVDLSCPLHDCKGRYKWLAWNTKRGMKKEAAMQSYIDKVRELIAKC